MFGFSFGELVVLVIVGIVVIGPKDMPRVLRRVGQWAGKLRRMASDIRAQSGIDEVLRGEGIAQDIAEIRKLARGEMEDVSRAARAITAGVAVNAPTAARAGAHNAPVDAYAAPRPVSDELVVHREREYPREGADSYGALADTALVYAGTLPASPLARDPLYRTGDPNGVVPDEPRRRSDASGSSEPEAPEPAPPEQPHHDA